jgi:hypothetical protein
MPPVFFLENADNFIMGICFTAIFARYSKVAGLNIGAAVCGFRLGVFGSNLGPVSALSALGLNGLHFNTPLLPPQLWPLVPPGRLALQPGRLSPPVALPGPLVPPGLPPGSPQLRVQLEPLQLLARSGSSLHLSRTTLRKASRSTTEEEDSVDFSNYLWLFCSRFPMLRRQDLL